MNISIALCTYNGAKFLAEQLDSFNRQTRLPDELVVCDDCSTDETVEILENFASAAPFQVYIRVNKNNLGSTKNFEMAISLCKGDLIFLSDQDDVWMPEKLRRFEDEFIKDDNIGLVFCDGELVDENLMPLGYKSWKAAGFTEKRQKQFSAGDIFSLWTVGNVVSGCMMAFRARYKTLILPIPNNFPNLIHDHWITLLLTSVSGISSLSSPLVKYRQHSGQQLGLTTDSDGGVNLSLAGKLKWDNHFTDSLSEAVAVQERLQECAGEFLSPPRFAKLNHYVLHLRARAALENKQAARVTTVFRELMSRRYHRYSNGIKSAVKDLIS